MSPRADGQTFLMRVARRIASERRAAKMTQEELANRLGIAVRNLQRVEGGHQNLTLLTVAKIASAIGVRPEDLLR